MAIPRDAFDRLGGFDPKLVSGEDQDLALRHTSQGGAIVYVPEAEAIHHDDAVSLRRYCRRSEWGSEYLVPFVLRHPELPDNVDRVRVNGSLAFGREPVRASAVKLAKTIAAWWLFRELLFAMNGILESIAPRSRMLRRLDAIILGIHLRRGFARGIRRFGYARA